LVHVKAGDIESNRWRRTAVHGTGKLTLPLRLKKRKERGHCAPYELHVGCKHGSYISYKSMIPNRGSAVPPTLPRGTVRCRNKEIINK
jgi:hypothetical protein